MTKDDETLSQKITFIALNVITGFITVLCISNALLFYRNGRFKNMALFFFYLFSFLTFLSKYWIPLLNIIVRITFFLDVAFDYSWCVYQIFKNMPPYAYATTAYCYMTNW